MALAGTLILLGCQSPVDRQGREAVGSDGWTDGHPAPRAEAYEQAGRRYRVLPTAAGYRARGKVTHYVKEYQGMATASGEPYEASALTAAHRTLPLDTRVRVTDPATGRSVVVRINDRGPFRDDRLIGLSWAAASQLGTLGRTAEVEVIAVAPEAASPRLAPAGPTQVSLPQRPTPVAASRAEPGPRGGHSVQAGAFRERTNAERLRVRLSGAGLGEVRIAGGTAAADGLYRVLLGPEPSRAAAERVAAELRRWGVTDPVIVAH